ncbi:MAG: hypothetical protein ACH0QD_13180 [Tepidibacillus sp.]
MSAGNSILVAIDIGNDGLKAVFGRKGNGLYIPNVISKEKEKRQIAKMEAEPLDALHVQINSGAVKENGVYVVGELAVTYQYNMELTQDTMKSESDQPIILLLTALAYHAATTQPGDDIKAFYVLGTGLPLTEIKLDKRQSFIDKLKTNTHEVTFLRTPQLEGKKVRITFEDIFAFAEGHAAVVDLTTNEDGSQKNPELNEMTILIHDIGGLTSDAAIIRPRGKLDNLNSESLKDGVSPYLDNIIERVQGIHGYPFKSRHEVVEVITHNNPEKRNKVSFRKIDITPIVDEELMILAEKEFEFIKRMWLKVPSIDVAYIIGGGGSLLKPYLEQLNEKEGYPIRFIEAKDSIWMNAKSYFKLISARAGK